MSAATVARLRSLSRVARTQINQTLGDVGKMLTIERRKWSGGAIFDAALGVPRRRLPHEKPEDSAVALLVLAERVEREAAILANLARFARERASEIAASVDE